MNSKKDPEVTATSELQIEARRYSLIALSALAEIAGTSKNHAARVAASREILDRGHGKTHLMLIEEDKPGNEIQVIFGDNTHPKRAKRGRPKKKPDAPQS